MTAVVSDVKLTGSPPPRLWRNRAFNLLWGGQAVSGLGSSMSQLIGATTSVVFVGVLCGALAAPWLVRKVPLRLLVMGMCWTAAAVIAAGSLLTGSILISVPLGIAALGVPAINASLSGYQAATTPDRLLGRVVSVIDAVGMVLATVATLLTGAFFTWFGGPGTILALAGVIAVSAVVATVSKGMRNLRPLSEMGAPA